MLSGQVQRQICNIPQPPSVYHNFDHFLGVGVFEILEGFNHFWKSEVINAVNVPCTQGYRSDTAGQRLSCYYCDMRQAPFPVANQVQGL